VSVSRNLAVRDLLGSWTLLIPVLLAMISIGQAQIRTVTNEWSVPLPTLVDSSPAVAPDGTIYFGTFLGDLYALKPDGSRKWIFNAGREIKSSPGIGPDGTIYFGSRNHNLYAVQPNGQEKWAFKTGSWIDSSPAIGADGTVFFGSWDKNFYAVSTDGNKKWSFQTAGEIVSSPAIGADGAIYFGSHDHNLYCLAADGKKNWEYATGAPIISSPCIDKNGAVYITSVDGCFYALTAEGHLKWRLKTGGITESSPVIGQDGTIFVGVNERIWAIAPEGTKKWQGPGQLPITATPLALADNSVCFVSQDGYLFNIEGSGNCKWMFHLGYGGAAPVMRADSNIIYSIGSVLNVGFSLYAVVSDVPMAQSPWPKFRSSGQNTGRI
jgi:outer membrane protein assembly factor BamB